MLTTNRQQNFIPTMFNEFFNYSNNAQGPMINIADCKECVELEVCVPGLSKEQLSLTLDERNNLVIEFKEEKQEQSKEERTYIRRQFSKRSFKQTFILSETINREKITAKVENGILFVTLPKITKEEMIKNTKTIAIN